MSIRICKRIRISIRIRVVVRVRVRIISRSVRNNIRIGIRNRISVCDCTRINTIVSTSTSNKYHAGEYWSA